MKRIGSMTLRHSQCHIIHRAPVWITTSCLLSSDWMDNSTYRTVMTKPITNLKTFSTSGIFYPSYWKYTRKIAYTYSYVYMSLVKDIWESKLLQNPVVILPPTNIQTFYFYILLVCCSQSLIRTTSNLLTPPRSSSLKTLFF